MVVEVAVEVRKRTRPNRFVSVAGFYFERAVPFCFVDWMKLLNLLDLNESGKELS